LLVLIPSFAKRDPIYDKSTLSRYLCIFLSLKFMYMSAITHPIRAI